MRIVVTGSRGQVACSLAELAAAEPGIELIRIGRPTLDLTDPASVARAVGSVRPDIVISAAAYTAVDRAELEPDIAHAVNVNGAAAVAAAAAAFGAPVIHLSTDYVFSGDRDSAWTEDDSPAPCNVYGRSKLAGEGAVAAANPRHVILRTAWVYSPFGANFVRTMLNLASRQDQISVVCDQWGNPTSALDLARALLLVAQRCLGQGPVEFGQVYHLAASGSTSWSGLATRIMEISRADGGPWADIVDIPAAKYPTAALRPLNSRLSSARFEATFGWRMPHWTDSVAVVTRRLLKAPAPTG